ncbi:hypothetical protein [Thermoanaerobacterium sp. PSU-2]|uniref:hypothetical protein n=1 Tax=Thermoanaerobacterium sp. PSU-2 TaxID=1930849 RepID=UPI001181037E|nr:hypothetical protein [Thermoanaerobacterium sp. PSU-2]
MAKDDESSSKGPLARPELKVTSSKAIRRISRKTSSEDAEAVARAELKDSTSLPVRRVPREGKTSNKRSDARPRGEGSAERKRETSLAKSRNT